MEKQGFLKRTLALAKKRVGPKTWLFSLGTRNLFPKIGTAYSVYQVASIILKAMADTNISKAAAPTSASASASASEATMQEALRLVKMLDVMHSFALFAAIVTSAGLWFLALVARGSFKFRKIQSSGLFKFGQFGPFFGIPAQFLMGMLLVPMVITGAMMVIIPGAFSLAEQWNFWSIAAGYVGIVVAMDYFAFIEKELPNAVIYTLSSGSKMTFPVGPKIVEEFDKALSKVKWVGSADFYSPSDDGRVVISVPILYDADKWNSGESSHLGVELHAAEAALLQKGCTVLSRIIPEKIQRDMPVALKKPLQSRSKKNAAIV